MNFQAYYSSLPYAETFAEEPRGSGEGRALSTCRKCTAIRDSSSAHKAPGKTLPNVKENGPSQTLHLGASPSN